MPEQKVIEKKVARSGGLEKNLKNSLIMLRQTSMLVGGLLHWLVIFFSPTSFYKNLLEFI